MGTTTLTSHELVLSQAVEILAPGGEYEKTRLKLRHEFEQVILEAGKITSIISHEEAEHATTIGRLLQEASKQTETFFKGIKQKLDAVKAPILMAEKFDIQPIESHKIRLGQLQTVYLAAERKRREEADRIAREEAQKREEEERIMRAIELEDLGETEAATELLNEPASPVHVSSSAPPKLEGAYGRVNYSATVVDLMTLVKAVAAGTVPLTAVEANMTFLNGRARNDKEGFSIPGVKLNKDEKTNFRR